MMFENWCDVRSARLSSTFSCCSRLRSSSFRPAAAARCGVGRLVDVVGRAEPQRLDRGLRRANAVITMLTMSGAIRFASRSRSTPFICGIRMSVIRMSTRSRLSSSSAGRAVLGDRARRVRRARSTIDSSSRIERSSSTTSTRAGAVDRAACAGLDSVVMVRLQHVAGVRAAVSASGRAAA